MKKLTKVIAAAGIAVATLFASNVVKAQGHDSKNTWRFGIGAEAGIPVGDLRNFSHFALGGTARLQYDAPANISFMLTSGYYNLFSRNYTVGGVDVNPKDQGIVPLKAGIKVYPAPNFYVSGEVGAGFETQYAKNTKLILAPGLGISTNSGIDLGVRYENFSGQKDNYGMVALRLAYGFKL